MESPVVDNNEIENNDMTFDSGEDVMTNGVNDEEVAEVPEVPELDENGEEVKPKGGPGGGGGVGTFALIMALVAVAGIVGIVVYYMFFDTDTVPTTFSAETGMMTEPSIDFNAGSEDTVTRSGMYAAASTLKPTIVHNEANVMEFGSDRILASKRIKVTTGTGATNFPDIYWDNDTGFYSQGDGNITATANNVNIMTIDRTSGLSVWKMAFFAGGGLSSSNGAVGIATYTGKNLLQVSDNGVMVKGLQLLTNVSYNRSTKFEILAETTYASQFMLKWSTGSTVANRAVILPDTYRDNAVMYFNNYGDVSYIFETVGGTILGETTVPINSVARVTYIAADTTYYINV